MVKAQLETVAGFIHIAIVVGGLIFIAATVAKGQQEQQP